MVWVENNLAIFLQFSEFLKCSAVKIICNFHIENNLPLDIGNLGFSPFNKS